MSRFTLANRIEPSRKEWIVLSCKRKASRTQQDALSYIIVAMLAGFLLLSQ
jgi:hypothetical protein